MLVPVYKLSGLPLGFLTLAVVIFVSLATILSYYGVSLLRLSWHILHHQNCRWFEVD